MMTSAYDLGKIRILLIEGFSDEELRALAFDVPGFKPVYHQLAHNSGKAEIVSRLLEHAERTRQLDGLVELAKSSNPAQYARYEPYAYDHTAASSPYPGMQYFDIGDADRFFGRELLTAKLVGRLLSRGDISPARFLAVVGASGSGKSSVVRAGLVPALQGGQPLADGKLPPEDSSQWPIHVITPTVHPLEALAASLTRAAESVTATSTLIDDLGRDPRSLHLYVRKLLARASTPSPALPFDFAQDRPLGGGGSRLLLVVDQFEELFTLCRNEAERRAFVDNLLTAVAPETAGPTLVVITLRADFYAHCAQYETLREALAQQQEYIGPMSAEELRRAIELPAQQAGHEFEPGLVDLILRDVGDEPGALPLLSHALLETWRRRQGHLLTLAGYAEAGGVRGAIAQTAEAVFGHLTPEQQIIARRIFLRLTELGEGAQDTRRRATLAELSPRAEEQAGIEPVLQTLIAARLVTTDQGTAEVAHEALIREWPALRQWLNDNREGLRLHRQLSETTDEWQRLNRDPGVLYRGAKLAQAGEWAEQYPAELNALEYQFLTASKQAEENERLRELEQARALAEEQARRAEAERQRAEEQKQAAINLRKRALIATGIGVMALIAAVAAGFFGWQATENAKLAATREAEAKEQTDRANAHRLAAEGRLQFEENPLLGLRLALEGWALSSAYSQIDQSIREMAQYGRLSILSQEGIETIYAPDDGSIFIIDWINAPGELRRTIDAQIISTLSNEIEYVTFSPDKQATYFVIGYVNMPTELRGSNDGRHLATLPGLIKPDNIVFSPDGAYVSVSNYQNTSLTELRRTVDGKVFSLPDSPYQIIFVPNQVETHFVYRGDYLSPQLRRATDDSLITTLPGNLKFDIPVIFSPDPTATYLVPRYFGEFLPDELRRTSNGALLATLSGKVENVIFSQDGTYLLIFYSEDTRIELRRARDGLLLTTLNGIVDNLMFSSDNKPAALLVDYSNNTPGELRRTIDGSLITTLSGPIANMTFSPDSAATYFVVGYRYNIPGELRRTADGALLETLPGPVSNTTFGADETGADFIVDYRDSRPDELRHTTGSQPVSLSGPLAEVTAVPSEVGPYFVLRYNDNTPSEIRYGVDGLRVTTLSGTLAEIALSPNIIPTYFIATYTSGKSELWQAQAETGRLVELGSGLGSHHFDLLNNRLIVLFNDGRAYLLDLAWLRAMGGETYKIPIQDLVRLTCQGPFASGLFDEAELKSYLGDREPQGCKK